MDVLTVDYQSPDASRRFVESLHHTGFAVLQNHPISEQEVHDIYRNWHEFFLGEDKHVFRFDPERFDGYFPPDVSETAKDHTVKDIKEFFHVYPWGRIPENLKEQIMAYYRKAGTLASELLGWVETHSPADVAARYICPLSEMIKDSPRTLLRVLHYPPLTGKEEAGAIRAAAHGDINLLTVLPAANEPGLQVLKKDGQWADVPCDFGNLVINIGDMLQEASRGYFPSTVHRVINPVGESRNQARISLPLFLHPRDEVVLSERHTAGSYLDERLRELGLKY